MANRRPVTQYFVASSLDGFIVDEQNNIDWILQFGDEGDDVNPYATFIADVGVLAEGCLTGLGGRSLAPGARPSHRATPRAMRSSSRRA